jgi:hypothetical protein
MEVFPLLAVFFLLMYMQMVFLKSLHLNLAANVFFNSKANEHYIAGVKGTKSEGILSTEGSNIEIFRHHETLIR